MCRPCSLHSLRGRKRPEYLCRGCTNIAIRLAPAPCKECALRYPESACHVCQPDATVDDSDSIAFEFFWVTVVRRSILHVRFFPDFPDISHSATILRLRYCRPIHEIISHNDKTAAKSKYCRNVHLLFHGLGIYCLGQNGSKHYFVPEYRAKGMRP